LRPARRSTGTGATDRADAVVEGSAGGVGMAASFRVRAAGARGHAVGLPPSRRRPAAGRPSRGMRTQVCAPRSGTYSAAMTGSANEHHTARSDTPLSGTDPIDAVDAPSSVSRLTGQDRNDPGAVKDLTQESESYTHGHHESVLRSHRRRTAANSAAFLLPHLLSDMTLLDVGCGPGTVTVDLAERLTQGSVVGVDASDEVLESARGLADAHGTKNISFEHANAYQLPFEDDSFDVVFAHQLLQHLS